MNYSQPLDASEFGNCPTCHKPLSKDRTKQLTWLANGFCAVVVLSAVVFVGLVRNPALYSRFVAPITNASSTNSVTVVPVVKSIQVGRPVKYNARGVTAAQFNQLKVGLTYSQVQGIMGTKGTRTGFAQIAGVATAMYHWQNPDGSSISVETRRDRLAFKAQFGLKGAQSVDVPEAKRR